MRLPAKDTSGIKWRYYVKAVDSLIIINAVNTKGKYTMKRKENPTTEESRLALKAQSPVDESRHESMQVTSFKQLAKAATSARAVFGGNGQWIKADDLFKDDYKDGLESPAFVITKAFRYVSKTLGDRFGIEIVMSNKRVYNVGFPFNDADSKRVAIVDMFAGKTGVMLGPVCLTKLDLGRGNPYYDIIAFDAGHGDAPVEIPFQEIEFDSDIPF